MLDLLNPIQNLILLPRKLTLLTRFLSIIFIATEHGFNVSVLTSPHES